MNPTPVAWMAESGSCKTHDEVEYTPNWTDYYRMPLYTQAQLNQAKADALRNAASYFSDTAVENVNSSLLLMAAELEKS